MTLNFHPQLLESVNEFLNELEETQESELIKQEILELTKSWEN